MIPINELLHYLGAEDGDDDVVLELERNAVAYVENQTGRYFGPPQETEEFIGGSAGRRIWLNEAPIEPAVNPDYPDIIPPLAIVSEGTLGEDPASIEDFSVRVTGAIGTPGRGGHLIRTGGASWDADYEYTVVYTRGYPAGEEPPAIRQLVLDLVSSRWQRMGKETLKSEESLGYSYSRFDGDDLAGIVGADSTINAWRRLVYA